MDSISIREMAGTALIILLLTAGYAGSFKIVQQYRQEKRHTEDVLYIASPAMTHLLALDFKNLMSELLFIRTLIYFGDRMHSRIMPDWKWLYRMADASTYLDPYNIDMYYFTNATLPWDGHMAKETNKILERGVTYRKWDFYIPYFIGFNNFFFLKDDKTAVKYFEAAARINPDLAEMAAKFHLRLKKTDAAIAFLKEIERGVKNKALSKSLKADILFLEKMKRIESAISIYESKYNSSLDSLDQLIEKGLIEEIPLTPFGAPLEWNKEKRSIDVKKQKKL